MPRNPRPDETIVSAASSQSSSFRTTIPAFIVSQIGLQKGDVLRWELIQTEKGDKYLKIHVE